MLFFLNNKSIADNSLNHYKKGNPGIGGTPYLTILIALSLKSFTNNRVSLVLTEKQNGLHDEDYRVSTLTSLLKSNAFEAVILNNGHGFLENINLIKKTKKK